MTRYHYKVDPSDNENIWVRIFEGSEKAPRQVAVAKIVSMATTPVFEAFGVVGTCQGRGLAYALTHLMLLYCKDRGKQSVRVINAHHPLNIALRAVGFTEDRFYRDPTFKPAALAKGADNTGDYTCGDLNTSLSLCKAKMLQKGLIGEGLRNAGP